MAIILLEEVIIFGAGKRPSPQGKNSEDREPCELMSFCETRPPKHNSHLGMCQISGSSKSIKNMTLSGARCLFGVRGGMHFKRLKPGILFDSTAGFPGEGPEYRIVSADVTA